MIDDIYIIIGSSGGIGAAFVKLLSKSTSNKIYAFSRTRHNFKYPNVIESIIDVSSELSIKEASEVIREKGRIKSIIIATGFLYDNITKPEKSLTELNFENLEKVFCINAFAPILIAKYFMPLMNKKEKAIFAAFSARVSSISDNHLGGWYSYRSSKSALNMLLKTLSIETKRRYKNLIIVGLHPGTVDTNLSRPFQSNVPKGKLFTPDDSVELINKLFINLSINDSGNLFSYDGNEILP